MQKTMALLKILALGNRQIHEGKVVPAKVAINRLRKLRKGSTLLIADGRRDFQTLLEAWHGILALSADERVRDVRVSEADSRFDGWSNNLGSLGLVSKTVSATRSVRIGKYALPVMASTGRSSMLVLMYGWFIAPELAPHRDNRPGGSTWLRLWESGRSL